MGSRTGMKWTGGGGEPRCVHTGDPFEDPAWPCDTIDAIVTALTEGTTCQH